ncbi:MAG: LytTR family DNA-binding domain-containing protein [Hespellia sp.]|nr:LytTR family DNA-binding domain-containing protein [Hespellia sp.]
MLRIAVCDDEKEYLEKIEASILNWMEGGDLPVRIYCFENGDDLLSALNGITFDIIFLDIVMPLLDGMDTAREIRNKDQNVKIIFLTSSPEFALDSYEVKAYNYLLKPISDLKLSAILDECSLASSQEPKNITLKTALGYQKLYFQNIEYIEAQNKKVLIFLRDNSILEVSQPLRSFEDQLTRNNGFCKCHRSYLVYLPNVNHFSNNEIITRSGRSIPISRGYGKAFQEAYFTTMFQDETIN